MDWLVLHSSGGGIAHALLAVRFVVAVIALKPLHITVALESDDMGCYSIQEPSIVRNNQRRASEGGHSLF